MDDLLDQPFRATTSLAAYRQAYEELEGEVVISLDFDMDLEPEPHTRKSPAIPPGSLQLT